MKKLSEDELNLALDSLKKLRSEKQRQRKTISVLACCYAPACPAYYSWEQLPYEFICPNCGKHFGKNVGEKSRHKCRVDGNKTSGFDVKTWEFESIMGDYEKCKEAGYDIELDVHCLECIKTHSLPPMALRFRAPGKKEYTISYPQLEFYDENSQYMEQEDNPKRLSDKHFFPGQYSIAVSFITDLSVDVEDAAREEVFREWLDREVDGSCGGKTWTYVFNAFEGILGLSLKRRSK